MATGRERRAEKLNERLRGAQRTNVGDDSFSLDIPIIEALPIPIPSPARRTPNTSVKRKRLDNEVPSAVSQAQTSASRTMPPAGPKDLYEVPDTSEESLVKVVSAKKIQRRSPTSATQIAVTRVLSAKKSPVPVARGSERVPKPTIESIASPARLREQLRESDELAEPAPRSPSLPRSEQRRTRMSSAVPSTVRLRSSADVEADVPPTSSPLARKAPRNNGTPVSRASVKRRQPTSRLAEMNEPDELSPDRPIDERPPEAEEAQFSESHPVEEPEPDETIAQIRPIEESMVDELNEPEEAEEIDAVEAARVLGRKRPRRSLRPEVPEVEVPEIEVPEAEEEDEPAPKRRRGKPARSPVAQRQSVPKSKTRTKPPVPKPKTKAAPKSKEVVKSKETAKSRRKSGESDEPSIEIIVQRFANVKQQVADDADEEDPLQSTMPFANRGETVVDVLAQVCREVVDATLAQFQDFMAKTDDKARKKESRIKMRAIEAYGEELNARLLQHAIYLNDWQTLRKRVRHVQKEKLALRDEILRLKAEREQVALQMDAVRIQHEEDTKESTYRLNTSTIMHDVDLAVEQGRDAPDLSPAEEKEAEMANLELLVSRISQEASSASSTGGILNQVQDFNAFLERAALALESR